MFTLPIGGVNMPGWKHLMTFTPSTRYCTVRRVRHSPSFAIPQLSPKFALKMLLLHWKTQELRGLGHPPGDFPLNLTPQGSLALRASIFCTFAQALLNQWGTKPSLAHGHPQAKLRHCDGCLAQCCNLDEMPNKPRSNICPKRCQSKVQISYIWGFVNLKINRYIKESILSVQIWKTCYHGQSKNNHIVSPNLNNRLSVKRRRRRRRKKMCQ